MLQLSQMCIASPQVTMEPLLKISRPHSLPICLQFHITHTHTQTHTDTPRQTFARFHIYFQIFIRWSNFLYLNKFMLVLFCSCHLGNNKKDVKKSFFSYISIRSFPVCSLKKNLEESRRFILIFFLFIFVLFWHAPYFLLSSVQVHYWRKKSVCNLDL